MGTSLTGLTPATTYDALIKVGDNGPLSATAKVLSDGLGNDSPIALSTTSVGIGTATPVSKLQVSDSNGVVGTFTSSNFFGSIDLENTGGTVPAKWNVQSVSGAQVGGSAGSAFGIYSYDASAYRLFINSSGNVGIGTTTPNFILETTGTTGIGVRSTGVDGVYTDILSSVYSGNNNEQNAIQASVSGVASDSGFRFQVSDGSGLTTQTVGYQMNKDRHIFYANGSERVRVTTSGLTFNGDTAAANALDDYEEGTFTPTIAGSTTAGTATYSVQNARYTKIGRQVSCQIDLAFSGGTGTGDLQISGLPFTESQNATNPAGSIGFFDAINLTALNFPMVIVPSGTARMDFYQGPVGGGGLSPITYDGAGRIIVSVVYLGS